MTLELTGADPDPAQAGQDFEITASGGSPQYLFKWKIGISGTVNRVGPQESNKLKIKPIPTGTAGQQLWISVEDGNEDEDSWSCTIVRSAS